MSLVVIMRGLPGSGKSTMAEKILKDVFEKKCFTSGIICSNDDYPGYYPNAVYEWTKERAKEARKWCKNKFDEAIKNAIEFIVVDNCHLTTKSYTYYKQAAKQAGYKVSFNVLHPEFNLEYACACASRNKHNVSVGMIINMMKSWEN